MICRVCRPGNHCSQIAATLAIWYVFYKLLRVPLPWGVLAKYAF